MTTSAPRKRMPRAEREQQMLAVAEEVFTQHGFVAASMDEIAARVGVSKPMLYEYFGSKEGLLVACIHKVKTQLNTVVSDAGFAATSPEDALRRGFVAFFRFAEEHRDAWNMIMNNQGALAGNAAEVALEEIRRDQSALDKRLIQAYAPDMPERQVEALGEIIVGACERLSRWYLNHDDVTPEQAAEYLLNFAWLGFRGMIND